ncbi:MAG: hypothetical protein F4125_07395 [Acidimicrobiaceae bacterium]|nr:hypothetical protein [Acidimicrobiaceae bacterium]
MAVNAPDKRVGYVFCARIGDHPRPLFRFVETGQASSDTVISETLACLAMARPSDGFSTPRVLDDDTALGAFDAWQTAQSDIIEKWNFMADKANLEPRVPPRLRRTADVLREHPPTGSTQDEIDRAIDTICAPYPERTIRIFQAAMKKTDDLAEQATEILNVIRTLGLEPYVPPEPLPEITTADVHLVTWLALV